MADDAVTGSVAINSTANTQGFEEAQKGLRDTETSTKSLGTTAKDLGYDLDSLMTAFVGLAALTEVIAFFKDAAEAAYNHDIALRSVAQAALISGADMAIAKARADEFTSALSLQTGVIKDQLLDAYGKVYLATGNVAEAEKEATLAANMAAVRHIDVATALRLVEAAATGVPGRFDRIVGGVTEGTTAFEKHESMTRRLIAAYGDVSKVTNDAAAAQDKSARKWDEFKETIGGPVLAALNGLKNGALGLSTWVIKATSELLEWFHVLGQSAGSLGTFLVEVWKGPAAAFAAFKVRNTEIDKEHNETIAALEAKSVAAYLGGEEKKTIATVTALDFRGKETVEKTKAVYADLEKLDADLAKAKEKLAKTAKEKYIADTDALVAEEKAALGKITNEMIGAEAAREKIREIYKTKRTAALNEWIKEETVAADKSIALEAKVAAEAQKWDAVQVAEARKMALAQEKIDKEKTKILIANSAMAANEAIKAGEAAFGSNKEFAIASAIVSTYQAAAGMLAAQPVGVWNYVLAALAIVEGLAQVAKIESTPAPSSSGAGFDDAYNDQAAEVGGRGWARHFLQRWSAGATMGAGQAGASAQTTNSYNYDNRRTTNVTGVGLVDASSTEMLKKLQRGLEHVNQNSIGAARIGSASRS
jgi:hypothetical protein